MNSEGTDGEWKTVGGKEVANAVRGWKRCWNEDKRSCRRAGRVKGCRKRTEGKDESGRQKRRKRELGKTGWKKLRRARRKGGWKKVCVGSKTGEGGRNGRYEKSVGLREAEEYDQRGEAEDREVVCLCLSYRECLPQLKRAKVLIHGRANLIVCEL